ncbi:histone-like nucleoid-structuring protein Lsr2 [Rhodococcus sp. USK10]|uniref:Lsr2 family DNA-binding protein n=1 Tax=Rhodococcus sp. USK10 TaxID=2789739 RepID=UPI00215128B2|nr:histone-like nucleoid-structuring protein Lsr2 [Rhodococcus sp. USK10]
MAQTPRGSKGSAKTTREIREWAIGAGHDVSSRGRISAEIVDAFEGAHAKKRQPEKVQATRVSAKKVSVGKPAVKKVAAEKSVATKAPAKRLAVRKAPAARTTKEIREWAIGAGHDVSSRGRISAEIVEAFEGAQAKKRQPKKGQATRGPAKKAAAGKQPAEKVAARKSVVKTSAVKKPAATKAPAAATTNEIREWAIGAGLGVSSRGRISAEIVKAFDDAQKKKVKAKTARAKKVAAGKPAVKKAAAEKTTPEKTAPEKPAARKPAARKAPSNRAAVRKAPAKRTTKDIREWAIGEGLDVSSRGRISAEIVDAFHVAQAKEPAA